MSRHLVLLASLIAAGCAPRPVAAPIPPRVRAERAERAGAPCSEASTTVAMHECLARELAVAEAALRAATDSLRQRGAPAALVDSADAAWRSFRTHECALAGARYEGGSLQGIEVAACRLRMTRERTAVVTGAYEPR